MKIKLPKSKSLKKQNDELWSECIKARAKYKSELSGKTDRLHSHHIAGKDCYRLRWELENGICLTAGEHFYGVHHQSRKQEYENKIKALRGDNIFERLELLRQYKVKVNLQLTKIDLEQKLKEFRDKL